MNRQSFWHQFKLRDYGLSLGILATSLLGTSVSGLLDPDLFLLTAVVLAPFSRRKWPLTTTIVVLILLVMAALLPELSITVIELAGFTAYISLRHLRFAQKIVIGIALLLGTWVSLFHIVPSLTVLPIDQRLPYVAWGITFLISCGLIGELRRRSIEMDQRELQRKLDQQQADFEQAALAQRTHIAREIHDIVTHSLTVIVAQADGGIYASGADRSSRLQDKDKALRTISSVGRDSLKQMRGVVGLLRDSNVRSTAPQVGHQDVERLMENNRAAGLSIDFTISGTPPGNIPQATSLTIYRICQEALTNAHKHGNGEAELSLTWASNTVIIEVSNPATEPHPERNGHGLQGIRERAELLGGTATAGFSEGTWLVNVLLPLPVKRRE